MSNGDEERTSQLLELAQAVVTARGMGEFADKALPIVAAMMSATRVLLYFTGKSKPGGELRQRGLGEEEASRLRDAFTHELGPGVQTASGLSVFRLEHGGNNVGLLGLDAADPIPADLDGIIGLLAVAAANLDERANNERQLAHLNAYLAVSSVLAEPLGLQELLETTLYCSLDVVSAETASVLLLDEEKKNFVFYQVEGPTKPVLTSEKFPADKGIAASVLETGESKVINDVTREPHFYGNIDTKSGFRTRNMIAVPLIAGEEKVGVLEVLNKAGGADFTEDEHMLLRSIAKEIAFAIRNAKIFEFVANSYCRQRQGQPSCKDCRRPLGSWTPCVKYRQVGL